MRYPLQTALAVAVLAALSLVSFGAELPDLASIKLAAESGNPIAQFEYAQRINAYNHDEQFLWFMRSAAQGYAPAQDAVGAHYDSAIIFEPKKKQISTKEALRWTSRAAYQGFPASQLRLAEYYERGVGVPKDPVTAYMWTQIAFDNPQSNGGHRMIAGMHRDRIIANTSSENIMEGQRRAAAFTYPSPHTLNPIESELLFSQLQLGGVFHINGRTSAAVNNVRFYPGETKDVKVDDHLVELTCTAIAGNYARFKIVGVASEITLVLKH